MAYTAFSVVFGEQPSAAKWNTLGTNDAHFYSFLGDNLDWQTWSPSYGSLTVGNGTVTFSKYARVGNIIIARWQLIAGTTTSLGGTSNTVSLPVTHVTGPSSALLMPLGLFQFYDQSTGAFYNGYVGFESTTTGRLLVHDASSTYLRAASVTSAIPVAIATTDVLNFTIVYEAA